MLPELFVKDMLGRRAELVRVAEILFGGPVEDRIGRDGPTAPVGERELNLLEAVALATTPKRYATAAYRDTSCSLEQLEKLGDAVARLEFNGAVVGGKNPRPLRRDGERTDVEVWAAKVEDSFLSNASMAQRARRAIPNLDQAVLWPRGVQRDSREADAIRADVFEALLGVIYCFAETREQQITAWRRLHREELEILQAGAYVPDAEAQNALKRWSATRGFPYPESWIVAETGGHNATVTVEVRVGGLVVEAMAPRKGAAFANGYRAMLGKLDAAERAGDLAVLHTALIPTSAEDAAHFLAVFCKRHGFRPAEVVVNRQEADKRGRRHAATVTVGAAEFIARGGNPTWASYAATRRALEELFSALTAEGPGRATSAQRTVLRKARSPQAAAQAVAGAETAESAEALAIK